MSFDEDDVRRALTARSAPPSAEFRDRLSSAVRDGRAQRDHMTPAAALLAVVLAAAVVAVFVFVRAGGTGHVAPATTTPGAFPGLLTPPKGKIPMPTDVMLSTTPDAVWALVGNEYLYRSTDRGKTWQQRPLPAATGWLREISFVSGREGWISITGSPETQCNEQTVGIWHTTDAGATWKNVGSEGIAIAQCKGGLSFIDPTHGFIGAWDENGRPVVYRTVDGGVTWTASMPLVDPPGFTSQPGGWFLESWQVKSFGGLLLVPVTQSNPGAVHVYVSRDGGATWSYDATVANGAELPAFVSATRWLQLIVPGQSSETTDGGRTWHPYGSDYDQAAPIAPLVVFADDQVGYATVRGEIQLTTDGGRHWTPVNTPGT